MRKIFVFLLFVSCLAPESQNKSHYDKIWESKAELRGFKVLKYEGRVVGYVDEEYVDKIFPHCKNPQQPHCDDDIGIVQGNSDKEKIKISQQTVITKDDKVESPIKQVYPQKKIFVEKNVEVKKNVATDLDKLNFCFSDLKIYSKELPKLGSFKISFKNTNELVLPDNFFEKLICKVDVIEGEGVVLTNWKGNLNINDQKLTSIKRTFSNDNNVSIKFTLKKSKTAKIKISFYVKDNPGKIFVVKNGEEETLKL